MSKHNTTTEDICDNESTSTTTDSVYDASTNIDSPTSTSSTFILNISDDSSDLSGVGEAISESNEVGGDSISVANEVGDDNSLQNLDEAVMLYKSVP